MKITKFAALKTVFLLLFSYFLVCKLAETLLFTIVTYVVTTMGKSGMEFTNTVNEIASQYLLLSFAMGSTLVCATSYLGDKALYRNQPFWNDRNKGILHLDRLAKREFFRGLTGGLLVALVLLSIFITSGQVSYLGIYITSTFGTPIFPLFFTDLISLITFVVAEEYIFRHKVLRLLIERFGSWRANILTSGIYTLWKYFQFSLTALDAFNIFLLSLALGYFFLSSGKTHRNIGFLIALLGILHPIAGLSLWSHSSPSFFLLKVSSRASELLSGGNAGPMAGLGMTSLLLLVAIGARLSAKHSV